MLISQAGKVFSNYSATACTDVTGFGLLGHLSEMLTASKKSAELWLAPLPLLEGVEECISKGVFSSLYPSNARLRHTVEASESVRKSTRYPVLFDPQTSGGLLASVPATHAAACLEALRKGGCEHAVVIGQICAPDDSGAMVSVLEQPARGT